MNQEQLDSISKYFETILVESSNGKLETTEVVREKRGYKNILKTNNYNLKNCNYSLFFCLCQDLESFEEIHTEKIKYFKMNILQKIFINKEKKLIEKVSQMIKDSTWIIIPSLLIQVFSKYTNFLPNLKQDKILSGTFDNIYILVNPNISSKEIYFGNYNSFKIIVNKNNLDFSLIDRNEIKILKLI